MGKWSVIVWPFLERPRCSLIEGSHLFRIDNAALTRPTAYYTSDVPSPCPKRASGRRGIMELSQQSVETLLDLVEIKLSCLDVCDRDDRRTQKTLEACRRELISMKRPAKLPAKTTEAIGRLREIRVLD
jgi:hypothetical protein